MSKFSASVNSDLGNGFFWVEIGDAQPGDRCGWKYRRVWLYQLTSDLRDVYFFFEYAHGACNGRVWKQFRCLCLYPGACWARPRRALLLDVTMVTLRRWADAGWWIALCVLAKFSLGMPKTTFAPLTHSQAISQSMAFSSLPLRNTNNIHVFFFIFFETLFFTIMIKMIS